jgi:hypothetical protein
MKNIVVATLALMAIIGVSYWAFDTLRQRTFTGENLAFEVGTGHVLISNPGDEPVPIEMRSAGQTPFRIKSAALGLHESSALQGTGSDIYHVLTFELPPGRNTIYVTSGSGVWFISSATIPLQATVTPLRMEDVQLTIMFAGAVILIALYCISNTMQHRWIELLREKSTRRTLPTAATSQNRPAPTS